jgi:hypothetical protein
MSDLSYDDLYSGLTGTSGGKPAPAGQMPWPVTAKPHKRQTSVSEDDIIYAGTPESKPAKTPKAASAPTSSEGTGIGPLDTLLKGTSEFTRGAKQGMYDVLESPATKLLNLPASTIAQPIAQDIAALYGGHADTPEEDTARYTAARNAYDQGPGGFASGAGRVAGQAIASIPFMAGGNELMALGTKGLEAAAPGVAALLRSGTGAGPALARTLARGAQGATVGAAVTPLTSAASDQPLPEQMAQGAEFGAAAGIGGPLLQSLGAGAANALTGSGGINPARAALAQKAVTQFGIPLRGSQISQSPFANYLDSTIGKMPFSGLEHSNELQRTAFSRAVASTFGEQGATALTPEVMSGARDRIGKMFDTVAANTTIRNTDDLLRKLGNVVGEAGQVVSGDELKPLQNQVAHIGEMIDNGTISGKAYQALTRKDAPLDRALNSANPNIRYYATQIRRTLDDALQASASPADVATLRTARLQWKNMRTVQDIASKAGIEGEITPSALLGAVRKSYKDMAYSGAGDIGDLANIGSEFLKPPPSSGTAERLALLRALEFMGLGGGTVLGVENPSLMLKGAALGGGMLAGGRLVGSVLKSKAYRNALLRSGTGVATGTNADPAVANLLQKYGVPVSVLGANQLLNRTSP